jgi:hypothetical protein
MADQKETDRRVAQGDVVAEGYDRRGPDNTKQVAEATKKQQEEENKRVEAAKQKMEEGRKLVHERERQALEERQKVEDERIDAERKAREEKAKEDERLAKLTPEQREAEVSPFVHSVPHFTPQNEPIHPAEFILSEANGQRSRGNAYSADPATVLAGQMLKKTAEATANQFATYVPAAVGADCHAIAIYSGGTIPGEGLRISVIVRDAEVNGKCLVWGSVTAPEQIIAAQTLATFGIIIRT